MDDAADQLIELASGGNDVVYASITYILGVNLETLVLTGTAALDGTGNELDNRLFGNPGANRLEGLAGNDWIEGRAGDDTLVSGIGDDIFTFAPGCGVDVVSDFGNGRDRINLTAFHTGPGGMLVTHVGSDTVLIFATGDVITLQGVAAITLQGDLIIA